MWHDSCREGGNNKRGKAARAKQESTHNAWVSPFFPLPLFQRRPLVTFSYQYVSRSTCAIIVSSPPGHSPCMCMCLYQRGLKNEDNANRDTFSYLARLEERPLLGDPRWIRE